MPIRRCNGDNFALHIPVCIVGGGACGLTAAVAAAQGGASVAVFEADTSPRGATAMSYGTICGAGTKKQAELGIDDSPEALFEDIVRATRGKTDEALASEAQVVSGAHCQRYACRDFRSTQAYPVRDYERVSDHCPVVLDLARRDDD